MRVAWRRERDRRARDQPASAGTRALCMAAYTAGASTTAVASFDRKVVTTTPMP